MKDFHYIKSQDVRLQRVQGSFVKGLVPLANVLDYLDTTENIDSDKCNGLIVKALRMLLASYTAIMDFRAVNISNVINDKHLHRALSSEVQPSSYNLFGDDLLDRVKQVTDKVKFTNCEWSLYRPRSAREQIEKE